VEQPKRRKYRLKNLMTLEMEQPKRRRYNHRYHEALKEGVRKKKNQKELRNNKRWRLFQHQKKRYPRYNI
jgi:hypothetical protein